jgi:hypothetical protein
VRFEPRLIPGDDAPTDEAGELLLSDDLRSLADQLRDDASHLARCYPVESFAVSTDDKPLDDSSLDEAHGESLEGATANAEVAARAATWTTRRLRRALVGTSLVSLSILGLLTWAYVQRPDAGGHRETARQAAPGRANLRTGPPVQDTRAASHDAVATRERRASADLPAVDKPVIDKPVIDEPVAGGHDMLDLSPVLLIQEASVPEQEGLYDLLEQRSLKEIDLSI